MNELEMEIGRTLGASAFFIYQFVKHNGKATTIDMQAETGLSRECVRIAVLKLEEVGVLKCKKKTGHNRLREYTENQEKETWKFH